MLSLDKISNWSRRRWVVTVAAATALAVGVAVAVATTGRSDAPATNESASARHARDHSPALLARFEQLRQAHSNRCSLTAAEVARMPVGARLQGSCCSSMDLHAYQEQVSGLRGFAAVAAVPGDPYDIPVGLAQRLLDYDRTITLTPSQQATYDQAMKMNDEHGPCCCQCWRWDAFAGQAKRLIAVRRFTAAQIARIWDLEDGCGGAGHHGHDAGRMHGSSG